MVANEKLLNYKMIPNFILFSFNKFINISDHILLYKAFDLSIVKKLFEIDPYLIILLILCLRFFIIIIIMIA